MKRLLITMMMLVSTIAASAGNSVRFAGGPSTGEYIGFARSMCGTLGALFQCNPLETKGAQDNIDRLRLDLNDPGAVDIIITKANIGARMVAEPGFGDKFVDVRSVAGEAIFLVMKTETANAVRNWSGVKEAAFLLSLGLPGEKSGDTALFNELQAVAGSPLQALEVKQYKDRPSLIAAVQNGEVRMAFFGQYANPDNALFKLVNDGGLVMMGIVDPDFVQLPGSYSVQSVPITNAKWGGFGGAAKQLYTTTARATVIARNPKSYGDIRSQRVQEAAIAKIRQAPETDLLPKVSWVTSMINATSITASSAMSDAYATMKGESVGAADRIGQMAK